MSYLHTNIQFLRKQKKLDTATFKELTGFSGSILNLENGNLVLLPDELIRIADALNYTTDRLLKEDIPATHEKIRNFKLGLLAMDVDGVLTDGGMYYTQQGDEYKKFNTKDGLAIKTCTDAGIKVAFISSGINDHIIKERAQLLGVPYIYVGTWKKLEILTEWCNELHVGLADVAYIGDDVNDLPAIKSVGLSACPSDAVMKVRQAAQVVLENKGGECCVREFIERFIMPVA